MLFCQIQYIANEGVSLSHLINILKSATNMGKDDICQR